MPFVVSRRRLVAAAAVVVAVLAAIAVGVVVSGSDDDPAERARALAEDPGRFESGIEAAETLGRISQHLGDALAGCPAERATACRALGVAAGYAEVVAAQVLTCTAPGRFEVQTSFARFLDDVLATQPTADRPPSPPPLPNC